MKLSLQVNRIQYPLYNLGPGKRIGIWVQGCTLACKNCISKDLWPLKGGKSLDIPDMVKLILKLGNSFDGITISGGEPFQQYAPLIAFCTYLKRKTNLSIWTYTGYQMKELLEMFPDKLFLNSMDYLVDGRYVSKLHSNKNYKGSKNQRLYKLTGNDYTSIDDYPTSSFWSFAISEKGTIYMAGIPKEGETNKTLNKLKENGFDYKLI